VKTWSDNPFPATVPASDVAERAIVVAENRGESSVIYEIGGHPGWLAKRYKRPPRPERQEELARLIALPAAMAETDRTIVDTAVAWPVARIVDGTSTLGVIIGKAPAEFFYDVAVTGGRMKTIAVTVDHLAMSPARYQRLGLPAPGLEERLSIVRALVTVGELLERRGLVYGDWSYSNAFWSPTSHHAFVIDVDSCAFGGRPWVESNAWDDPLVPGGSELTTYTDRYKLILLATRCLTGTRTRDVDALAALPPVLRGGPLERVLRQGLTAAIPSSRPSLPELLRALDQSLSTADNVSGWVDVRSGRSELTAGRSRPAVPAPANSSPSGSSLERAANVTGWRPVGAPLRDQQQPIPPAPRPATTRPAASGPAATRPPGYPAPAGRGRPGQPAVRNRRRTRRVAALTAVVIVSLLACIIVLAFVLHF